MYARMLQHILISYTQAYNVCTYACRFSVQQSGDKVSAPARPRLRSVQPRRSHRRGHHPAQRHRPRRRTDHVEDAATVQGRSGNPIGRRTLRIPFRYYAVQNANIFAGVLSAILLLYNPNKFF